MKAFNREILKTDQAPFHSVTVSYSARQGLKLDVRNNFISVRNQVRPASGCDFNTNGTSCSSKSFFEINGLPAFNGLFMPLKTNAFLYCLPENLEEVKVLFMDHLKAYLSNEAISLAASASTILKHLK